MHRKHIASYAFISNKDGKILIARITGGSSWILPGGSVKRKESPRNACMREVKEEIGIDIEIGKLVGVSYGKFWADCGESIIFLFHGGIIKESQIENIHLQKIELSEYKFVDLEDVQNYIHERLKNRFIEALGQINRIGVGYYEDI